MTRFSYALTMTLASFVLAPVAFAQPMAVAGLAAYVSTGSDVTELADGRMIDATTSSTVLIEDDSQSPLHLMSQDCSGTNLLGADGALMQSVGSCVAVDSDGDIFWISFVNPPSGGTWRYTAGTGKFAGIEGGGTSEVTAIGHGGQVTIRYEGQATLR